MTMDTEKHKDIARRAYAFWLAEGQPDGRREERWQRAVREIEPLTRRKKRKS
jgi:hypothetical protein